MNLTLGTAGSLSIGNAVGCAAPAEQPFQSPAPEKVVPVRLPGPEKFSDIPEDEKEASLIAPAKLDEILNALESPVVQETLAPPWSDLLLRETKEIRELTQAKDNPPEFPFWVNKAATPLKITYRERGDASLLTIRRSLVPESKILYQSSSDGESVLLDEVGSIIPSFKLNFSPEFVAKYGPAFEGLILTKEYASLMFLLTIADDFYDFLEAAQVGRITYPDGKPIEGRERKVRAGATVVLKFMDNPKSSVWRLVDGLPIFMTAYVFEKLSGRGMLPEKKSLKGDLRTALDMLEVDGKKTGELSGELTRLTSLWIAGRRFLPPAKVFLDSLHPETIVGRALKEFYKDRLR